MDLNKKIEEIRQKPEHIRIRYVWGSVAIIMFFVVTIWVLSLNDSMKEMRDESNNNNSSLPDIKQELNDLQDIKNSSSSIDDITKSQLNDNDQDTANNQDIINEGVQNNQN